MPTAKINGFEMHYEIAGAGPTIVWLHGLMGSIARSRRWQEGIEGLAGRGFRVVSYDARGHGESTYTEDESHYTWTSHADDMRGLLDHLGVERAVAGGGSMGAGVSLTLAIAHPERVEKLLLVALPAMGADFEVPRQVFGGLASLIEAMGVEQAAEIAMGLPQFAEMKDKQPEQYQLTREWLLSLHPQATVLAVRGLLNGPRLEESRFGEVAVPTLIVAHPDDPVHTLAGAQQVHAAIPGSRLVVAPEVMYYHEHLDELLDTVESFLRGESSAK